MIDTSEEKKQTKYGKYFIRYDTSKWRPGGVPILIHLEDKIVRHFISNELNSNLYFVHWVFPGQEPREGQMALIGHPPHTHPYNEILIHIGTDPNNPSDLGAEIEMYMGPELEKHVITQTCAVFIPAGFIHSPYKIKKVYRPYITIMIIEGPERREELHLEVLPEDLRQKVDVEFWKRFERMPLSDMVPQDR